MNITLAQAEAAIIAAKKKAVELNTKMNICVVDAGSNGSFCTHGWGLEGLC